MWLTMERMLDYAKPGEYALGAFHAINLEQMQGILEAAFEERAPVIVSMDERAAMYAGIGPFLSMSKELAEEVPVPVAVQFDHVRDLDLIKQALAKGITAVLCDVREIPLYRSLDKLQKIKKECDKTGALLEIEMLLPSADDLEALSRTFKTIGQVAPYSICVSADQEHKTRPHPDFFEMAKNLNKSTDVNFSLAGAGQWPDEDLKKAIESGAWKVSIGTRINRGFTEGLKQFLDKHPERIHPRSYLGAARDSFRAEVAQCIRLLGSSGKI